jgi:hypothetical protein
MMHVLQHKVSKSGRLPTTEKFYNNIISVFLISTINKICFIKYSIYVYDIFISHFM